MSDASECTEMELDLGIARIYIKGDENTSYGEVREDFIEQREELIQTVKDFKREEYELEEEFAPDRESGPTFS